jgi:hypothetical protein
LLTRYVDKATGKLSLFYDGDLNMLSCVDLWPEAHTRAELVPADSEDEAIETLMRKVKDCFPEGEGWFYEKGCSLVDLRPILDEIDRRNLCFEGDSREDEGLEM